MTMVSVKEIELTEKDFHRISNLVYKHCGINLHAGKKELVRARLAKRLRKWNIDSFPDYLNYVFNDSTGKEFSVLIDLLSTNLTSFFRENKHFHFLGTNYLPKILERKRKERNFKIRAWSAGCSSGEEAYSIAITLLKIFEDKGQWDIKVLATDISTRMLEVAKQGSYELGRIQTVPEILRKKYLIRDKSSDEPVYKVSQKLKDTVVFKYLNLMGDWPVKGPLDFIFCRNVMIYFDKPTQQNLINRYTDLLDQGAVLFTGHSESLTGITHKLSYVQPTIYKKN